jgi:organic radical activating enzyme
MNLRTFDRFWTVQGTGHLVGMPQWFIRTAGCSVKCPIREVCDEPDALNPRAGDPVSVEQLADEALAEVGQGGWVHITGGEPCDQPEALTALGIELERCDLRIHLQTSGTLLVPIRTDWLTVSPKSHAAELRWTWGQEMIVVLDPLCIHDASILRDYYRHTRFYDYYLCPLWKDGGAVNTQECFDLVKQLNKDGYRWRLTGQFHKYQGAK